MVDIQGKTHTNWPYKGKPDEALVAEINTIAINPVVQCNGIVKHLLDPKILDKDKL
jgi:hypothetical protein